MSEFLDGLTKLPRNLVGGAAVSLGADQEKVQETLGLNEKAPESFFDDIVAHPTKYIGEAIPYMFLPSKLVRKTISKLTGVGHKLPTKGVKSRRERLKDNLDMAATFGAYGAVDELASAQVQGRESHAVEHAGVDAGLTLALAALTHGAIRGSSMLKSKAQKSKYVKDIFREAGLDSKLATDIINMTEADRAVALNNLNKQIDSSRNSIHGAILGAQPHAKFGEPTKTGLFDSLFGSYSPNSNIEKIVVGNKRPPMKDIEGDYFDAHTKDAIQNIRNAGDVMDSSLNTTLRHSHNLGLSIREAIPDPKVRAKITRALDVNGERTYNMLTPYEKGVSDNIRIYFNDLSGLLNRAKIINGHRENYIPHLLKNEDGEPTSFLDEIGKRSHISKNTARSKERVDERPLHEKKNAVTLDISELVDLYGQQVSRAAIMRNVFDKVDFSLIKNTGGKVTHATHPTLVAEYLKVLRASRDETIKHKTKGLTPNQAEKVRASLLKEHGSFDEELKKLSLDVHPDYLPSLDMLFKATNINDMTKAAVAVNAVSKRMLIFGSLFHFNALSESSLFAGAGGMGAMLKGAAVGFVGTGFNPLGAAVGAGLGAGISSLVKTKGISNAMRHGEYGDSYDFALRYIDIKPPRDVDNDAFYGAIGDVQNVIDKHVPSGLAKGALKDGTAAIGGINKAIDVLMWDRLMSGSKLVVFEKKLEELTIKNLDNEVSKQLSQHELATMAGQFVNDAFGGQNWRKLAEGVDNAFGRKIASAMATPNGKVWTNLIMFAPDWTISNVRILAKAFPGINKNKLSRQMYQRYAVRAAIYYMIMGTAVQQMLTGTNIWDNDDPTRLDLGDGRQMSFSKQLSEPFKWVIDPIHEAKVKQSSILKGIEEQVTNQQYTGANGHAPEIRRDNDTGIDMVGNSLIVAGQHFAPIFVQDLSRNGLDGVYGFFGHPVYGKIKHKPQENEGVVMEIDNG